MVKKTRFLTVSMSTMLVVPLTIVVFSNIKIWRVARESAEYLRSSGYTNISYIHIYKKKCLI